MLRRAVIEKYCTRVSKEGLQDKVHEVLRQSKLSSTVAEINTDGSTFFFFQGCYATSTDRCQFLSYLKDCYLISPSRAATITATDRNSHIADIRRAAKIIPKRSTSI